MVYKSIVKHINEKFKGYQVPIKSLEIWLNHPAYEEINGGFYKTYIRDDDGYIGNLFGMDAYINSFQEEKIVFKSKEKNCLLIWGKNRIIG